MAPHLLDGPLGDRGGRDARHSRQELAVLLPAHGERAVRVGRQGRHEEGLLHRIGGERCREAEAGADAEDRVLPEARSHPGCTGVWLASRQDRGPSGSPQSHRGDLHPLTPHLGLLLLVSGSPT